MAKENEAQSFELKICERCTAFWLRPAGRNWRYCNRCIHLIAEVPTVPPEQVERKNRGWRKRKEAA